MIKTISLLGLATLFVMVLVACGTVASPAVSMEEKSERSSISLPTQETMSDSTPSESAVEVREVITPRASRVVTLRFEDVRFEGPEEGESENSRSVAVVYTMVIDRESTRAETPGHGYRAGDIDDSEIAKRRMRDLVYDLSVGDRGGFNRTNAYEALSFWSVGAFDEIQAGDRFVIYAPLVGERYWVSVLDRPLGTVVEIRERTGDALKAVVYLPGEEPWEMKFRQYPQHGPTLESLAMDIIYSAIPSGHEFAEGDRVFIFPMEYEPAQ
ncbi:MAG TPA: hypothetical protein VGA53_01775 [Candidatus Paceibacterota bacterium]